MGRPRVLISGPAPPPPGGIASVIQSIVDGALAEHYEFVRFATSVERFEVGSQPVRLLNAALARGFGFDGIVNFETRAKLAAYRQALDPRPDLVHLHSSHGYDFWLATLMARMAQRRGIPAVQHVHGNFDVYYPSWSRAYQAAFRRALHVPDRFIVLSQSWKRWFSEHVDPDRIEVLYNNVDCARFTPRDHTLTRDTIRLLFVGTRDAQIKGAYDLLAVAPDVVRELPNLRFVFVGNDPERLEERFVRGTALETHIEFAGLKTAAEMPAFYTDADLLLLPSHMEGMPMALLEAMASGLPVLASAINAIPEVVREPENGVLIRPGDREALARGILALAHDTDWRRRAGAANRLRALDRFDRSNSVRALGPIYERALAARPK